MILGPRMQLRRSGSFQQVDSLFPVHSEAVEQNPSIRRQAGLAAFRQAYYNQFVTLRRRACSYELNRRDVSFPLNRLQRWLPAEDEADFPDRLTTAWSGDQQVLLRLATNPDRGETQWLIPGTM